MPNEYFVEQKKERMDRAIENRQYKAITTVDQSSLQTLPTSVVLHAAGITNVRDNTELARLGRLLAMNYDLKPTDLFGTADPKELSTRFGASLTMKDVQRLSQNYEPIAFVRMVQSMRETMAQKQSDFISARFAHNAQPGEKAIEFTASLPSIKRASEWSAVIANTMDIKASRGMAMAISIVNSPTTATPKSYLHNFDWVKRWWESTSDTPFDQEKAMAITLNMGTKRAGSVSEVQAILFGGKLVKAQQAAEQARVDYQQSQAYYDYDTGKMVYPDVSAEQERYHKLVAATPGVGPNDLGELTTLGPDFWDQIKSLEDDMRAQNFANMHNPLTKAFQFVGYLGMQSWKGTEIGLVHLGADIMSPVEAMLAGLVYHDEEAVKNSWEFWQQAKGDALYRINNGQSVGDIVEEAGKKGGLPLPSWTSVAFDFAVGWYVDPLVIAGKGARLARGVDPIIGARRIVEGEGAFPWVRAVLGRDGFTRVVDANGNATYHATQLFGHDIVIPGRVMPHLDEAFSAVDNVLLHVPGGRALTISRNAAIDAQLQAGFKRYVTEILPKSRVANKLFESLASGDEMKFLRDLDLRTPGTFVGRGLDYGYMSLLRKRILELYAPEGGAITGSALADARQAFEEGLTAHFVGMGPEGSAAEWAVRRYTGESRDTLNKAMASGLEDAPADLQKAYSEYIANGGSAGAHVPFTVEGPKRLGLYGPRRAYRQLVTSELGTATAAGRRWAGLRSINPGRRLTMSEADSYVLLHSRRWNTFTEREVRHFQGQALEARERGYWDFVDAEGQTTRMGYEDGLKKLVDDMNDDALDRILSSYNIPSDSTLANDIRDAAFSRVNGLNRRQQSFLAGREGTISTTPVLETQLKNEIYVVDPVDVRRIVREQVQFPQRAKQILLKHVSADAPELTEAIKRSLATETAAGVLNFFHTANQARIRLWKALTVARPGYIPRVILGDENARFLVTTRSISERLLAQDWRFNQRLAGRYGFEGLAAGAGKHGLFSTRIYFPDGTYHDLKIIGAYENNARAAMGVRRSEQTASALRSAEGDLAALNTSGDWGPVAAAARGDSAPISEGIEILTDSKFLNRWQWAMEKQFAKSTPGRVALESVAGGDLPEVTRAKLLQWAQDDHFTVLKTRLGKNGYTEWSEWMDDVTAGAHGYTVGSQEVANAALTLTGADLRAVLDKYVKAGNSPVVHGSSVEAMMRGEAAASGWTLTNKMYNGFVSLPEAGWNRNPFFKTWKRRAESGYYQLLAAEGHGLTPELRQAVDNAATEFGLEQVRSVMFDLTRQSRFTELLQIMFPFPQPFFEGFQTWASIALRNPEGIGRMMQLFRTGVQSGFLRKDSLSGEYVVPMGAFRWFAAPWAILHGENPGEAMARMDRLGISFIAPMTSFNMLASTTIEFSKDTPLVGKYLAGIPFPMPGLDPGYALVGQHLFKDSAWVPAVSYLFQYGPGDLSNLLPNTVKAALGIAPAETIDSLAASVLKSYQVQHIRKPDGSAYTADELSEMAHHDAEELYSIRQWAQMMSPGALRLTTAASQYEGEWQDLLDASPTYDSALTTWLERHPDLSWIPIGKTFFSDGRIADPTSGAYVQMPRVPSSQFFEQLYNSPGAGEMIRAHPELAGLFLYSLDPSITEEQNLAVYSKQLRNGFLKMKPRTDIIRDGENLAVRNELDAWYRSVWDPAMDRMLDGRNSPDYESAEYKNLIAMRREELSLLAKQHPMWAYYELQKVGTFDPPVQQDFKRGQREPVLSPFDKGDIMYDWPSDSGPDRPYGFAIDQIRNAIDQAPGTENVPGFVAIRRVFDVYDGVRNDMVRGGYTDIFQTGAIEDHLPQKLANGLAEVYQDYPGIEAYVTAAFGIRLTPVRTKQGEGEFEPGQREPDAPMATASLESAPSLQSLPTSWRQNVTNLPDDVRLQIESYDTTYNRMRHDATGGDLLNWQRNAMYQHSSNFVDETWKNNPEVLERWWNSYLTPNDRKTYKADLVSKPSVFYSAWDWHVLGVKLKPKTINALHEIGDWRVNIQKQETNNPEGFSEYQAYKDLDARTRTLMKGNPQLKTVASYINNPAWILTNPKLEDMFANEPNSTAADIWQTIAGDISHISKVNAKAGLTGVKDFDSGDASWYAGLQKAYLKYVTGPKGWTNPKSPYYNQPFAEQWDELARTLGGNPVQNWLIPDAFFPLGGTNA